MRVRLNELASHYEEISKKYGLTVKDVELLFVEALIWFFGTEDVFIVSEGVEVKGKYRNIRSKDFGRIVEIFNTLCIERTRVKMKSYLTVFFAERGRIVYAKVEERGDYHYTLRLMLSKETPLRYVAPIRIERNGEKFPESLQMVPVDVLPSMFEIRNNMFWYKVHLFSKRLAKFHLNILQKKLFEKYHIMVRLEAGGYSSSGRFLQIKNRTGVKLNPMIITYVANYFKTFGVTAAIKNGTKKGGSNAA